MDVRKSTRMTIRTGIGYLAATDSVGPRADATRLGSLLPTEYCLLSTSFLLDGFGAFADDRLLFTGGAGNARHTGFAKRC